MTKIIAQMIGRNEAERYLPEVLEHLYPLVDQIVFTDDGSDDETYFMAKDYGASVIRLSDSLFETDESQLREIAWQHMGIYSKPGDWIISIDCDEIIHVPENLREMLEQTDKSVVMATFFHMWNEHQFRVDKAWAPDQQPRLFKYYDEGHVMKRTLACGQYPTYVKQLVRDGKVDDFGVTMQHMGYASDDDKLSKFEKYMRIDGGKFHSLRHLESIIDEDPILIDWEDEWPHFTPWR